MTLKNLTFKNRCLIIGLSCWMVAALVLALIISASAADLKVIGAVKGGTGSATIGPGTGAVTIGAGSGSLGL